MTEETDQPEGPDLTKGIPLSAFPENGMLTGHAGDETFCWCVAIADFSRFAPNAPIITARWQKDWWLMIRCAVPGITPVSIFAAGEALHAPAFDPIACWAVEQRDGKVFVRRKAAGAESKVAAHRQRARKDRDRGRRRGRLCRGRNAAALDY